MIEITLQIDATADLDCMIALAAKWAHSSGLRVASVKRRELFSYGPVERSVDPAKVIAMMDADTPFQRKRAGFTPGALCDIRGQRVNDVKAFKQRPGFAVAEIIEGEFHSGFKTYEEAELYVTHRQNEFGVDEHYQFRIVSVLAEFDQMPEAES
jgi:hypothetical protein